MTPPAMPPDDEIAARRAAIDARQERLGELAAGLGCEGVVLFQPAHVAWFAGGWNVRGLLADTERPGLFTNGRQRWVVCSNVDTQRLFDEELDRLGFQLKEWQWAGGRAALLGELTANKKIAADRPFPGLPPVNEQLRTMIRPLAASDTVRLKRLGAAVGHAVEAAARTMTGTETEQELAGQVAHRLVRAGADVAALTVQADGRDAAYGRAGYGPHPVKQFCRLQATGSAGGLYATAARTVSFGPPPAEFAAAFDLAVKLSASYRGRSVPGETIGAAGVAGRALLKGTPHEFSWRDAPPGYGTGWVMAEELRRLGQDEPLVSDQAVVWQARVGIAAVVDTVLVTAAGPEPVTPADDWPFKRVTVGGRKVDVPDVLVQ